MTSRQHRTLAVLIIVNIRRKTSLRTIFHPFLLRSFFQKSEDKKKIKLIRSKWRIYLRICLSPNLQSLKHVYPPAYKSLGIFGQKLVKFWFEMCNKLWMNCHLAFAVRTTPQVQTLNLDLVSPPMRVTSRNHLRTQPIINPPSPNPLLEMKSKHVF